jgi:hypothetical protein
MLRGRAIGYRNGWSNAGGGVGLAWRCPGEPADRHSDQARNEHDTAGHTVSQPGPTDPPPSQGDRPDNEREQPKRHRGTAETETECAYQDDKCKTAPAERVGHAEPSST